MKKDVSDLYRKNRKKLIVTGVILLFSVFLSLHAVAYTLATPAGTETNISVLTTDSDQYLVTTGDGWIVWADNRNSGSHLWTWDLYSYYPSSGNESLFRQFGDYSEPSYPKIDGQRIVWQSGNTSITYDIRLFDAVSDSYSMIAVNVPGGSQPIDGPRPEISGDYVIWREQTDSDVYTIWLYQISSQTVTDISSGVSGSPLPKISGNHAVWQAFNDDFGLYDIIIYDISDGTFNSISGIFEFPMPAIDENILVWQAFNIMSGFFDIFFIPDISVSLSPQLAVDDVAIFFDPTPNPIVSRGNIVWTDARNGDLDIYLYNISTDQLMQITTDPNDQRDPGIYGPRIVWVDMRNGDIWNNLQSDIFMYTVGPTDPCPNASFDTNATIGGVPFPVHFIDTSAPTPDTWTWEFGDGNISRDQNPDYIYTNQGTYSVNLIVSTPYCRDGIAMPNLIHVGTPPEAAFSGLPVFGFAPLEVNFTDESSGSPSEWIWDFGDGSVSTEQNPNHTFVSGGSYKVTLSVNNSFGTDTIEKPNYVSVLERTGSVVSTSIDGLNVASNQTALFDSSKFSSYALSNGNTTLWFIPPPENGIREMTLFADGGFTDAGGIITGNLTGVSFRSEDIPLTGFSPAIGTDCSISYLINSSAYPIDAQIATAKWEGYIPSDYDYFLQTIYHAGFAGIVGVAYEVQFQKTNLNVPHNATLFLTVNSSWVEAHGTKNRTWVLRIGDDMTGEVLPTTFSHSNMTTNLDHFVADSPHGLSKFALTGLHGTGNPLQIIVLIVQQLFSPGSDSSSDGVPTFTPTKTPTPTPTLTPVPTTSPPEGTGILPIDSEGGLTESIEIQSKDLSGTLSIFADTKALTANGTPLSNISIRRLNADEIAFLPLEEGFNGIAYELLPDGATFDTPIVLTLAVPDETWSDSKRYLLQWYNRTSERWEPISTTTIADSHTLIAQLSHFSIIGLFSYEIPTTTITTETPTTSPPVTTTPSSLFVGLLAVGVGIVWWTRGRR
jgi:beta propeller repeat protein